MISFSNMRLHAYAAAATLWSKRFVALYMLLTLAALWIFLPASWNPLKRGVPEVDAENSVIELGSKRDFTTLSEDTTALVLQYDDERVTFFPESEYREASEESYRVGFDAGLKENEVARDSLEAENAKMSADFLASQKQFHAKIDSLQIALVTAKASGSGAPSACNHQSNGSIGLTNRTTAARVPLPSDLKSAIRDRNAP